MIREEEPLELVSVSFHHAKTINEIPIYEAPEVRVLYKDWLMEDETYEPLIVVEKPSFHLSYAVFGNLLSDDRVWPGDHVNLR